MQSKSPDRKSSETYEGLYSNLKMNKFFGRQLFDKSIGKKINKTGETKKKS